MLDPTNCSRFQAIFFLILNRLMEDIHYYRSFFVIKKKNLKLVLDCFAHALIRHDMLDPTNCSSFETNFFKGKLCLNAMMEP